MAYTMVFMRRLWPALVCFTTISFALLFSARAEDPTPAEGLLKGAPAIRQALARLNVLGSVLMIGAHPDDENNAVLAYLSRGLHARTGYLSLNRGEGGQNLLGNEQGPLLGVIRTQELLAARRDDGASQYFTRAIDFGFTTSLKETLDDWNRERILSDVVWVIRRQQPDVIVLVFTGTTSDGHGNHQASAVLGREAWEAAADPGRFPEQLNGVKPWKAHRLMRSRFTLPPGFVLPPGVGSLPRDPFPDQPTISVDTGEFDPVLGRSYLEISTISRSEHRSQGQGSQLFYGSAPSLIATVAGDAPEQNIFDGIDVTWNRIPGGARVGSILASAARDFDDAHPEKTAPALLEARGLLEALPSEPWTKWKLGELDQAIGLCLGLHTEAAADAAAYVPGAKAKVRLTALNRSPLPVTLTAVHLTGWGDGEPAVANHSLARNKPSEIEATISIPPDQPWSQPFWLREPGHGYTYSIGDQTLIGRADTVPEVTARFDFAVDGKPFSDTVALHYRTSDPATGEVIRPVVVQPPVALDVEADNFVFPTGAPREINLSVRALAPNQKGEVRFETPQGWKVQPAEATFELKETGEARGIRFRVTPPATEQAGRFRAVARANGVEVATGVDVIAYPHIPAQTVLLPAEGKLSAVPLKTLAKRVGYVMGASDKEPESLRQMGCQVELLDEKDLSSGDLGIYDAIVTGVRAYALRPDLRANQPRLLDYMKNGGTLIVQYNNNADRRGNPSVAEALDHLGPYPFQIAGNDARVTQEDAAVRVLEPQSPLLNTPNKITQADFDGWVQERGLYFASKWDEHYQTPLETHDRPDAGQPEKPLQGALLYTRYGKGAYIFTAFSWFRELPAGVPGAYRIFANLLSAGKAAK